MTTYVYRPLGSYSVFFPKSECQDMVTNVCSVSTVEPANVQSPTFLLFLKQITNWHLRVLDFSLVLSIVLCENDTDICY